MLVEYVLVNGFTRLKPVAKREALGDIAVELLSKGASSLVVSSVNMVIDVIVSD